MYMYIYTHIVLNDFTCSGYTFRCAKLPLFRGDGGHRVLEEADMQRF